MAPTIRVMKRTLPEVFVLTRLFMEPEERAECLQPESLRYSRLKACATGERVMESSDFQVWTRIGTMNLVEGLQITDWKMKIVNCGARDSNVRFMGSVGALECTHWEHEPRRVPL